QIFRKVHALAFRLSSDAPRLVIVDLEADRLHGYYCITRFRRIQERSREFSKGGPARRDQRGDAPNIHCQAGRIWIGAGTSGKGRRDSAVSRSSSSAGCSAAAACRARTSRASVPGASRFAQTWIRYCPPSALRLRKSTSKPSFVFT